MNCPKCGQHTLILDEEQDDHCYMCSFSSATRAPTTEEVALSEKYSVYGSYVNDPKFKRESFNSRSLRESLPILKRRSINWNTRNIRTKANKAFNTTVVHHG